MAIEGVLYVWSLTEFSTATRRDKNSGMYRPLLAISPIRSRAAGDSSAIHSPPSAPKTFCGAK